MLSNMVKKINIWKIKDLVPYENNARVHSQKQLEQIKASISKFGFVNPLLVDSKKGIIAGHGRYMAGKALGLEKVPVIVLDHLTEAEKRALIIADNKISENAGWNNELLAAELKDLDFNDFDMSQLGFSQNELDGFLSEKYDIDFVDSPGNQADEPEIDDDENDDEEAQEPPEVKKISCPKCGFEFAK